MCVFMLHCLSRGSDSKNDLYVNCSKVIYFSFISNLWSRFNCENLDEEVRTETLYFFFPTVASQKVKEGRFEPRGLIKVNAYATTLRPAIEPRARLMRHNSGILRQLGWKMFSPQTPFHSWPRHGSEARVKALVLIQRNRHVNCSGDPNLNLLSMI